MAHDRWSKLVYDATFNPICALTSVNTGDLQPTGTSMEGLLTSAMNEIVQVAQASGCLLPKSIIDETLRCNPVEEKICPSMQIDLMKVYPSYQIMSECRNNYG